MYESFFLIMIGGKNAAGMHELFMYKRFTESRSFSVVKEFAAKIYIIIGFAKSFPAFCQDSLIGDSVCSDEKRRLLGAMPYCL